MTITKKTLTLLKRHGNINKPNYNYRISLIAEILLSAGAICGNTKEGYELYYTESDGSGLVGGDYARKCAAGMQTRYPQYIQTTLTHGNNQVCIADANKLVVAILGEQ